jgi:hypothetical protein
LVSPEREELLMPQGEPATVPLPYALAMVISDFVWRDPGNGKCTILGTFSNVYAHKFPAVHPIMAVYAALTDGRGKVPITVQIVDVDEARDPIAKTGGEVEFDDPRMVVEMVLHITGVRFPAPGEYRMQLIAGASNELLMERRILVVQTPDKPQSAEESP